MNVKAYVAIIFSTLFIFIDAGCSFSDNIPKEKNTPFIHEYLLPSFAKMQSTAYKFEKQVDLYEQAVILEDAFLLDEAKRKADEIKRDIQSVMNLTHFPTLQKSELRKIRDEYLEYTSLAHKTILLVIDVAELEKMDKQLEETLIQLKAKELELNDQFTVLSEQLYHELEKEISDVNMFKKKIDDQ